MISSDDITFLQWALPKMGYRWEGYRKPRNQVLKRIRERLHKLELTGGYADYKQYLEANPNEWKHLDRLCDVTISKFFRDRKVWNFLRDQLLPRMMHQNGNPPLTCWSVGCCNGEEPYSLAMISEQLAENGDWANGANVEILATDRNPEVLQRAQKGTYPAGSLKELTQDEIDTFFHKIDGEDYEVKKRLKLHVTFEQRDIQHSIPSQVFDLILCRNLVFTYFTRERQLQFMEELKSHLIKNGLLILGSNEKLPTLNGFVIESKTHRIHRRNSR